MANILFSKRRVNYKRLPQTLNFQHDIHSFDSDNLYPQRFKELSYRSPLAKQAIEVQSDFIQGDGWTNEKAGDTVANSDGYTFNDLLSFLSMDYSLFLGLSIHFNFNGLGKITEVNFLPFEFTRFGLPNEMGKHKDVKISNNWEGASQKNKLGNEINPITYPLFNPLTAGAEVLTGKGGQVLYFTTIPDLYPLSSIDSIADAVQTDAEIQLYELNNTKNGFHGGTYFHYPGDFDSPEEEEALANKVKDMTGSDGPGVMVVLGDEDYDLSKSIVQVEGNNNDRLFENTTAHIEKTIIQNFAVPPQLFGILQEAAVFSNSVMQDGYVYYNVKTKKLRNVMARIFKSFGELWHEGPLDFGDIKEREYETPVFRQEVINPGQTVTEPEPETEAKLANIYGYNRHVTGT